MCRKEKQARGGRKRNGPRSKVTELLPIILQSARILLLYSAGILTHDFRVVIIGTPQGTSKDHKGPGELNLPGAFSFACDASVKVILRSRFDRCRPLCLAEELPRTPRVVSAREEIGE
jgi:hypothetical protein